MPTPNFVRSISRRLPHPVLTRIKLSLASVQGMGNYRVKPIGSLENEIYLLTDSRGDTVHISRRLRAPFYRWGVRQRVQDLVGDYFLDRIELEHSGLLIDCGANVGELGIWARAKGLTYIPFEPEPLEALCNDLNNFGGRPRTKRYALWNETGILPFYSKPDSADSSLILPDNVSSQFDVETFTLDRVLDCEQLSSYSGTVIFKVEAEGAEPEVLEGASKSLKHIDWVTLDCGHERGVERANTFVETNTLMQDHGFRLCDVKFGRLTSLYRNCNVADAVSV